ncbi:Glycerol kinase [Caulifigura coniformis]|uniref:Glycerol kinase n=1 Tax=Caulifigura coniformis TaxID=2527983 RepID=A0A517SB96_9PLAN|nr:FGGY family carbohydrate kinase [Caulifigura coniformis]QDT53388.1 Glycerol kinase [Caulifigura coniformis]
MSRCLGLDLGSTSIKAAVLDLDSGGVERIVSRPFPAPTCPRPGWFEIDAEEVARLSRELLTELLAAAPDCNRLLTCGQMGGLVLVDRSGKARSPYYSWRDQRVLDRHSSGETSLDRLRKRLSEADLMAIGREFRAGSTITLLSWLVETGHAPANDLFPVTLVDAVVARLCETEPVTEPTQALGLLDLATRQWHAPLFEAAGVGRIARPFVGTINDVVGVFRAGSSQLDCHPAVGDQQAALVGVGLEEEELSVNCSTGSQVSRIATSFQPGDYQIRPYFGGRLLNTLTQLPAGRSLNVLVDLLTELARAEGIALRRVWETIANDSARPPVEELDVDLAFFSGAMGDHGHIRQITTENLSVGSVFRAAFRNMAENYRVCADRVSAGKPWRRAVLSGGLTNKLPVLREMIASRLETPVRGGQEAEEVFLGLLRLARGDER